MYLLIAIYAMAGVTFAGGLIVAALTMGYTTTTYILYAAIAGFVVALPVAVVVAKKLRS
jgi:hypothetical protein